MRYRSNIHSWRHSYAATVLALFAAAALSAQDVDFLLGPVALRGNDAILATIANLNTSSDCAEAAELQFFEHTVSPTSSPQEEPATWALKSEVAVSRLGNATLNPGESLTIPLRGERLRTLKTIQIQLRSTRLRLGVDPCLVVTGTVYRSTGQVETIGGSQFSDEFSILKPQSESTCLGSDDCDDLISLCEQQGEECSFTCHIALPDGEGQACVFGSTND